MALDFFQDDELPMPLEAINRKIWTELVEPVSGPVISELQNHHIQIQTKFDFSGTVGWQIIRNLDRLTNYRTRKNSVGQ